MRIFRSNYSIISPAAKVVATLGNFDGVHLGHQQLIEKVVEIRDNYLKAGEESLALVITFYPHPLEVLGKVKRTPLLTTPRQRMRLLAEMGIDMVHPVHFTPAISKISAEDFIDRILLDQTRVTDLIVGPDARVGKNGRGDVSFLSSRMNARGAHVHVLPELKVEGTRVRSGTIRDMVLAGRLGDASKLLGRPFSYEGRVSSGHGRGRVIGFPTLNLRPTEQVYPPMGVYVTETRMQSGLVQPSVTNIGVGPTFGERGILVETYLLDFHEVVPLHERIEVAFLGHLRDERKFGSVEDLKLQIDRDVKMASEFFFRMRQ